jgi:hypothetical protein
MAVKTFLVAGALTLSTGLAVTLAGTLPGMAAQMQAGTGYAARVLCACHYVGGRDFAACRADLEPGMEAVATTLDAGNRMVIASIGPVRQRARFSDGEGCRMID